MTVPWPAEEQGRRHGPAGSLHHVHPATARGQEPLRNQAEEAARLDRHPLPASRPQMEVIERGEQIIGLDGSPHLEALPLGPADVALHLRRMEPGVDHSRVRVQCQHMAQCWRSGWHDAVNRRAELDTGQSGLA